MEKHSFDFLEAVTRIIKYLFVGLTIALAVYLLPMHKNKLKEGIIIGLVAACIISLFDIYIPSIPPKYKEKLGLNEKFILNKKL
jgi:hypothetical protein|tara:strand:- start:1163 stop:1414 length:252 start_codon:yes stop_codon:yes gene_type:complete